MTRLRLRIDIGGTVGTEAWEGLPHFPEVHSGRFGPEEGSSGPCQHGTDEPHSAGEWCGAVVVVENHLLAEYALAHYLEQARVLDACLETDQDR